MMKRRLSIVIICVLSVFPFSAFCQSLGEGLTNPKIEALRDFFQSYGIRIDPRLVNAGSQPGDHELELSYRFSESVYPTIDSKTGNYIGNRSFITSLEDGREYMLKYEQTQAIYEKVLATIEEHYTLKYEQTQAIYEKVLATIEELRKDARQYDRWDYHEDDADTIHISMVLNGGMGGDEIGTRVVRAYHVPYIERASEHILFEYKGKRGSNALCWLSYTCVIDTVVANKMLNIGKFLKMASPAIEPLSDKRRLLHDESLFTKYTWRQLSQFFNGTLSGGNGETKGMDMIFNTKEKAEQALQNLKQTIVQYVRLYPDEGIEYYPDITWGSGQQLLFRSMFSRSTMHEMQIAEKLEIHIIHDMDAGRWHLLFFVTKGGLLLPNKWQTICSFNNMEFEYD